MPVTTMGTVSSSSTASEAISNLAEGSSCCETRAGNATIATDANERTKTADAARHCALFFTLGTSLGGQGFAARLFCKRQQDEADNEHARRDGDRQSKAAVGLNRGADEEHHRNANEPAD